MATGISQTTRETVLTRDDITCQWCGIRLNPAHGRYSLQHRRARGMGGSKHARANAPEVLVLVCGSATTLCHGHIESHPEEAAARGFRIRDIETAAVTPVIDWNGDEWFLHPEGHRSMFAPTS